MFREWVGDENYAWAVQILAEQSPTADDLRKAKLFRNAEAELFMYFALLKLNVVIGDQGVVTAAKSQKFGEAVFSLATPKQINEMRDSYFNIAWGLVKKYIETKSGVLPTFKKSENE
jgi:hypothetical protein